MPDMTLKKSRPLWYNLSPFNFPISAIVSILHRASGILLFLGIIWCLYLLDMSLGSEAGFNHLKAYFSHPLAKLGILALLWALLHHLCAGTRFLLLDLHIGVDLGSARATSFAVLGISLVATAILGGLLW